VLTGQTALLGSLRTGLLLQQVLALLGAGTADARHALDRRWTPTAGAGVRVTGGTATEPQVRVEPASAAPDDVWAAALSHAADQVAALLARMQDVVGVHGTAVAAGGWTRLRGVRETRTAVVPRLRFSALHEPGARGAAVLAACAATGRPPAEVAERFTRTAADESAAAGSRA
jgi:hypothetical protein